MLVDITAQGRLLEVKVKYPNRPIQKGSTWNIVPRGTIRGLSKAARLRLLKELARIKWSEKHNKFITLTYPADYPTVGVSKGHLRAFLERWRRRWPDAAGVWRLEFQARGAPHFHIVSPNLPFQNKCSIQDMWGDIIDYDKPFTRIDAFEGGEMIRYVAKYLGKKEAEEDDGACRYAPTLKPGESEDTAWTGRCWGVHNKPAMPYHARYHTSVVDDKVYQVLRQRASEVWPAIKEIENASFSLFLDDAIGWLFLQD